MQIIKEHIDRNEEIIVFCKNPQDAKDLSKYLKATFTVRTNSIDMIRMHPANGFRIYPDHYTDFDISVTYSDIEWYKSEPEYYTTTKVDWCPDVAINIEKFSEFLLED